MNRCKSRRFLAISIFLVVLAVSAAAKTVVQLKDAQGNDVGTATLSEQDGGVAIGLNLHGLPPGEHGIHFHQNAVCEAPDFKSAGPHFNPEGKKHGLENPEGHHAGDNPNLTISADGKAEAQMVSKDVTLGEGGHSLFSNGGTSLVIHAKMDDQKTDPTGNSGDRIACGVIQK